MTAKRKAAQARRGRTVASQDDGSKAYRETLRRLQVELVKHMLVRVHYEDKDAALILPDPNVVFPYSDAAQQAGLIQR